MSKLQEVSQENADLFNKVWEDFGYVNYLNLKVVGVNKSKELYKLQKASLQTEYFGECPNTVICVIYEEVFDKFDYEDKEILVKEILNSVTYNTDKDRVEIKKPEIKVSSWGRAKFGERLINLLETSALHISGNEEYEHL